MIWRRLAMTIVFVLAPIAVLGWALRANPRDIPSPMVGRIAPDFSLPTFTGGDVRLSDLRGRVVVVNFWASWCGPCREEAAALEATWRRYRDAGVVMVGVNIQDQRPAARQFIDLTRASYPNVVDTSGATSIAYGIYGVPETFLLSADGRIRLRHVGVVTTEMLDREIELAKGRS